MQEALEQIALNVQDDGLLKAGKVEILDRPKSHAQSFDARQ